MKSKEDLSISVVVPFYNRSRFLKRLLDSIAAQTLPADKVYIIDNGSSLEETLNAWNIIKTHTLIDRCVFTSSIGKGNANYARNLGYELADTKYVAFLDSDDWWEPNHLSTSIEKLSTSKKCAIYSGAITYFPKESITNTSKDVNIFDNPFSLIMSPHDYLAQTSSYIINKSVMKYSISWDESLKRHQDYDYFASIFYNTQGWCFNPNVQVNIDWSDKHIQKPLDFNSLINFYDKWKNNIPNDIKKAYLLNMLNQTYVYNASPFFKTYYKNEIRRNNYFDSDICKIKVSPLYIKVRLKSIKLLDKLGMKHSIKRNLMYLRSSFQTK